jgi:hypothetical protein
MYNSTIQKNLAMVLVLATCLSTLQASAQPEQGGRRGGPPPQAFEACAGQTEGDSCSMTGRQGEDLQGSCIVPPQGEGELVCAPEGGPGGRGRPAASGSR